jgi:hypothetical protein
MSAAFGLSAINDYISSVSVSPATADQNAARILNYRQNKWSINSAISVDVVIVLSAAKLGQCIGLVGHNLSSQGVLVSVFSSPDSGSTWNACLNPVSLADDFAKLLKFDTDATSDYWKISFTGNCLNAFIDCMQISQYGVITKLQAPLTPPGVITAYETQYGAGKYFYAGKKSRHASIDFEISLTNQSPDGVHFLADQGASLLTKVPFFYAWNVSSYPNEVIYAWIDGDVPMPNYETIQLMSWRFKCKGVRK